jgi:hypothetical protein
VVALLRDREVLGQVDARRHVDELEAVEGKRRRVLGLVRAEAVGADARAVRGHRVGDVRALRVDVDRVRLADVRGQPDLARIQRVRDVDDLQAALLVAEPDLRDAAEHHLVVAAALGVGGVHDHLRVVLGGVRVERVEDLAALGRGLRVVLEAECRRLVRDAGRRRRL